MGGEKTEQLRKSVGQIIPVLEGLYPDIRPLLEYRSCYELLAAVILSAQCTDAQVNKVTPVLFERYPEPSDLAGARVEEIEKIIHSTGFYRNKARHIQAAARMVLEDFGGSVPEGMEDLLMLPGIGRKSANVIRGHCFNLPAIIVDTHFSRVTRRLGLANAQNPVRIEREIAEIVPDKEQTGFSMRINLHGRYICKARVPLCGECLLFCCCDFTADRRK